MKHIVLLPWVVVCILGVVLIAMVVNFALQTPQEVREQQAAKAARALARENLETSVMSSAGVLMAAKIGTGAARLWPVFGVLLASMALIFARYRFQSQVSFQAGDISTMIPASKAVPLTQAALRAREAAEQAKILMLQEDVTHKRLADNVGAIRVLKSMIPKEPQAELDAVDVTPAALPAFTGNVEWAQLQPDRDSDRHVMLGRDVDSGFVVQMPFHVMQSTIRLGLQGKGKSVSCLPEVLQALMLKHVHGEPVRVHLIDKDFGGKQSLGTRLEQMLPGITQLFDTALLGEEPLDDGRVLAFWQAQLDDAKERQRQGQVAVLAGDDVPEYPFDIVLFDEYTETISHPEYGSAIEDAVKLYFNKRKFGKYISMAVHQGTKSNAKKALNPEKMGATSIVFNTAYEQAAAVLGHNEMTKRATSLQKGQAIVKLPEESELVIVQIAIVTERDFAPLSKFITQNAKLAPGQEIVTNTDIDTQEERLTPDTLKALREAQGFSQRDLAKKSGVSQSKISDFERGKDRLSEEEKAMIQTAIDGQNAEENRKVINLNQYRKTA